MSKIIFSCLSILFSLSLTAQENRSETLKEKKNTESSFFWGLFKSKEYPKDKTFVFDFKIGISSEKANLQKNADYEEKSILGGATKWTKKKSKKDVKSINPETIKPIDTTLSLKERFGFMTNEIRDSRIVALGEQTHTPDVSFKVRADLIEYLVEYHNFDLILFESGLFDIQLASENMKQSNSIQDLQNGLYGFWGQIPQHKRLFEYLQGKLDNNEGIDFAGFDHKVTSKQVGTTDIYSKTLSALLLDINIDPNSTEYTEYIATWKAIEENRKKGGLSQLVFPMTEDEKNRFAEFSDYFQKKVMESNNKLWQHIIRGYDEGVILYSNFSMEKAQSDPNYILKINNNRDRLMADNLKFLLSEVYKDKKIILIGATYHFSRNVDKVTPNNIMGVDFSKSYTTGKLISKEYDEKIFTIGFTAPASYTCDDDTYKGTLACLQKNAGYDIAYHPLHQWDLKEDDEAKQQTLRLFVSQVATKHPNWNEVLDAVVLINKNN